MKVSPLLVSMFLLACADGHSANAAIAVVNLSSSACIKGSAATAPKDPRCVASQREGKTLALQVFGLQSLCLDNELLDELPWRGVAREEAPGRVVVSVEWPSDKTPACGACIYDFKAEIGPYDWPDRTDIKFEVRSCPTCAVDDSRSVSLDTKPNERAAVACSDEQLDAGAP
jgi:hypothetical protein